MRHTHQEKEVLYEVFVTKKEIYPSKDEAPKQNTLMSDWNEWEMNEFKN